MSAIRRRLNEERGWGLISSVLVVGILLSLSLPLLSLVDVQQNQSAHERKSESSFNLAEAALDASVFVLGKNWPGASGAAYPPTCTAASTSDLRCPSPDLLTRTYTGGDYRNAAWTVQIRDDNGTEYYDPAIASNPTWPRWDANGNKKVWVRADAHAAQGDRTIVALVKRLERVLPFPRNAVLAGWFTINTSGNKTLVDTKGETAQAAPLAVRCTQPAPSPCLDYLPDREQVRPDTATTGYEGDAALTPEVIELLKAKARALDTYFPSCPADPEGEMVYVETGNCRYTGGGSINTEDAPGIFMVGNGTIEFGGSMEYYGLAYGLNLQRSLGVVVTIFGTAKVIGSIAVDGGGGVQIGSSGDNLDYADTIWPRVTSFTGAAPVQGSWRELPAS
jgi:type II secretory pathway pseudopilin PulG